MADDDNGDGSGGGGGAAFPADGTFAFADDTAQRAAQAGAAFSQNRGARQFVQAVARNAAARASAQNQARQKAQADSALTSFGPSGALS